MHEATLSGLLVLLLLLVLALAELALRRHQGLEWPPSLWQPSRSFSANAIRCVDDAAMPRANAEVHALQNPPLASCRSARILEWGGFGGSLGLASQLDFVVMTMAVAWSSGRILRLTMQTPPDTSFFLESASSCGASNVYECNWAPLTRCRGTPHERRHWHRPQLQVDPSNNCTLPSVFFSDAPEHRIVALSNAPIVSAKCYAANRGPLQPRVEAASTLGRSPDERRKASAVQLARLWSSGTLKAAALAYFLRPNPTLQAALRRALARAMGESHRAAETIGLPIRASDKCEIESTCPSFADYMRDCERIRRHDPRVNTILLTSEDPAALAPWREFASNSSVRLAGAAAGRAGGARGWRFVFNAADVQQGTGGMVPRTGRWHRGWDRANSAHLKEGGMMGADVARLLGVSRRRLVESMLSSMHLQARRGY